MVVLKRRAGVSNDVPGSPSLPYGDHRDLPKNFSTKSKSFDISTSSLLSAGKSLRWQRRSAGILLKLVYILACISWVAAVMAGRRASSMIFALDEQKDRLMEDLDEANGVYEDALEGLRSVRGYCEQLEKTQKALDHEIRMVNEMFEIPEAEEDLEDTPSEYSPSEDVITYMEKRQSHLMTKIRTLKNYIKEESRKEILEKYGADPRRVRITVMLNGSEKSFTLEMAPIDTVPHAILRFLEMVQLKLWNNSVFWHHDDAHHVVAGALLSYYTGEPKYHHLTAMGWKGLSFAEFSEDFPHDRYTVGFSGTGPNFYINANDNRELHGIGGQEYHALPDEADPCFAQVVEGRDVVDTLYNLNAKDNDFTRIVKAELI